VSKKTSKYSCDAAAAYSAGFQKASKKVKSCRFWPAQKKCRIEYATTAPSLACFKGTT
jgi:hypothetical protein